MTLSIAHKVSLHASLQFGWLAELEPSVLIEVAISRKIFHRTEVCDRQRYSVETLVWVDNLQCLVTVMGRWKLTIQYNGTYKSKYPLLRCYTSVDMIMIWHFTSQLSDVVKLCSRSSSGPSPVVRGRLSPSFFERGSAVPKMPPYHHHNHNHMKDDVR